MPAEWVYPSETSDEKEPAIYMTDNKYRPYLNVGGELEISLCSHNAAKIPSLLVSDDFFSLSDAAE